MVRRDSENCHLSLSLSAVCECGISWSYSLTFLMSAVDSVKQKLSWVSYHTLPLPRRAVGVIVAVPGRTHLLFKLTFSIQFLKVVLQERHNFL